MLFELEDGIVPSARSSFTLDNLAPIASQRFIQQWADCAAKVNGPRLDALDLEASFAVSDEWNDKCYVARDKHKYFAVCWSTTA
ncbi:MAG: hypothetical protein KDB14_00255 [Planctomycetales bacterium]|nr:hypothetical protein [Planctomycetales bacterium]